MIDEFSTGSDGVIRDVWGNAVGHNISGFSLPGVRVGMHGEYIKPAKTSSPPPPPPPPPARTPQISDKEFKRMTGAGQSKPAAPAQTCSASSVSPTPPEPKEKESDDSGFTLTSLRPAKIDFLALAVESHNKKAGEEVTAEDILKRLHVMRAEFAVPPTPRPPLKTLQEDKPRARTIMHLWWDIGDKIAAFMNPASAPTQHEAPQPETTETDTPAATRPLDNIDPKLLLALGLGNNS